MVDDDVDQHPQRFGGVGIAFQVEVLDRAEQGADLIDPPEKLVLVVDAEPFFVDAAAVVGGEFQIAGNLFGIDHPVAVRHDDFGGLVALQEGEHLVEGIGPVLPRAVNLVDQGLPRPDVDRGVSD